MNDKKVIISHYDVHEIDSLHRLMARLGIEDVSPLIHHVRKHKDMACRIESLGVSACRAGEAFRTLALTIDKIPVDTEEEDKKIGNKFFATKKEERNDNNHRESCAKAKRKRKKKR